MTTDISITVTGELKASVIQDLADGIAERMELSANDYDLVRDRLARDPDFTRQIQVALTEKLQEVIDEHWSWDLVDSLEESVAEIEWFAELQQTLEDEYDVNEYESRLLSESYWTLETREAVTKLRSMGYIVTSPEPVKRKQRD